MFITDFYCHRLLHFGFQIKDKIEPDIETEGCTRRGHRVNLLPSNFLTNCDNLEKLSVFKIGGVDFINLI